MKNKLKGSLFILFLLLFFNCSEQFLTRVPLEYRSMVKKALQKAGENREELITFLNKCNNKEIIGASFLLSYMPERDLTTLSANFLYENVKYAYLARKQTNWGENIPDSLFLNYVLPYANIHERRDNWRKDFYDKFIGLVHKSTTPGEATIILNKSIWDIINVHYSPDPLKWDQSPYESIEISRASCTGLAIIFADACRSVGIPARFTGVPMWYTNSGNHSWIEVWDNNDWHFVESITSDSLDRSWFQELATHANHSEWKYGIYALSYKKTNLVYHNIFDSTANYLWAIDVTDRYSNESSNKDGQNNQVNLKVIVNKNGIRLSAKVILMEDDKVVSQGFSRGEENDLNDVLTFKVKKKTKYELIIFNNMKHS